MTVWTPRGIGGTNGLACGAARVGGGMGGYILGWPMVTCCCAGACVRHGTVRGGGGTLCTGCLTGKAPGCHSAWRACASGAQGSSPPGRADMAASAASSPAKIEDDGAPPARGGVAGGVTEDLVEVREGTSGPAGHAPDCDSGGDGAVVCESGGDDGSSVCEGGAGGTGGRPKAAVGAPAHADRVPSAEAGPCLAIGTAGVPLPWGGDSHAGCRCSCGSATEAAATSRQGPMQVPFCGGRRAGSGPNAAESSASP
mmetsp:Transcript_47591/g.132342  ORF Transcript_47591/g.132342 Transcript_47591/m.132342 type:complete len:255 (+) Transcript_47591:691-1455(+)